MSEGTDEELDRNRLALRELGNLLGTVDLSAPSANKFDQTRAWIAARTGQQPQNVAVYWVSKPGNFDVRFRQPGVLRDQPVLGVALVPMGKNLEAYRKPAQRLVQNGPFHALAICVRTADGWEGMAAYVRENSDVDATAGGLIDPDRVEAIVDSSQRPDEEVEGFDGPLPTVGWGEYPLDAVFVRTETRTVTEVVKRIRAGRYQLDPDFQRDFVWSQTKQSRLIESCMMRIPLPVFYVAEAKDGSIIVVDGLQRLTTFARYLDDGFTLIGLDDPERNVRHPLSGLRFSDLPVALAERIEDTQLTLYVLDAKAPERAKLDIFERVNSGVPLSRQQMRNCLFNGPATTWLREAGQSATFLEATGKSLDPKTMRDREAINRFCAFYLLDWKSYRTGDMDGFLAQALERMNEAGTEELQSLSHAFSRSMKANLFLFGKHAFRKSLAEPDIDAFRTVINIALFDVCSVLLADADHGKIVNNAQAIRKCFGELIAQEEFNHSITYSTNSTRQVRTRFERAVAAIEELL